MAVLLPSFMIHNYHRAGLLYTGTTGADSYKRIGIYQGVMPTDQEIVDMSVTTLRANRTLDLLMEFPLTFNYDVANKRLYKAGWATELAVTKEGQATWFLIYDSRTSSYDAFWVSDSLVAAETIPGIVTLNKLDVTTVAPMYFKGFQLGLLEYTQA